MVVHRWLCLAVSCFLLNGALALDPSKNLGQFVHRRYDMADGLPQNSVEALYQSRDGFLWLGTQDGLVRFDGSRFRVYNNLTRRDMPENLIKAIAEDGSGDLVLGTGGGVLRFDGRRFQRLPEWDGIAGRVVASLATDAMDRLWVLGSDGVGYGGHAGVHKWKPERVGGIPSAVTCLHFARTGEMWFGTMDGVLWKVEASEPASSGPMRLPQNAEVSAIWVDETHGLWVGTHGKGLYRWRDDAWERVESVGTPRITCLSLDGDGVLWVGTEDTGMFRFSPELGLLEHSLVAGPMILTMEEDHEGNLWVGTVNEGLHQFVDAGFSTFSMAEGLPDDLTMTVDCDAQGRIYVGTAAGGMAILDGRKVRVIDESDGLPHPSVNVLLVQDPDCVWLGTNGGLVRWTPHGLDIIDTDRGLSHNSVVALAQDPHQVLWVGTGFGGLNRVEPDLSVTVIPPHGEFTQGSLSALHVDRTGALWLGAFSGQCCRLENGRFTCFTRDDGLPCDQILSIGEDDSGRIWFATGNCGVVRFDKDHFKHLDPSHGLCDKMVFRILHDALGNLWMSSNRGIFMADHVDVRRFFSGETSRVPCLMYGTPQGMKSSECSVGGNRAGCVDPSGMLWFTTTDGLVRIDPLFQREHTVVPHVMLESVVADETELCSTFQQVPAGTRKLEFHFIAPTFTYADQTRYQAMLEGYDEHWQQVHDTTSVYFTNLPPGPYTFKVRAASGAGGWGEIRQHRFELRPYFHQTKWFYLLCVLALVGITVAAVYLRTLQLVKKRLALEKLVRERTRTLEMTFQTLKSTQSQLIETAHRAGMAEIATHVLHHIGNALNSLQTSSCVLDEHLRRLPAEEVERIHHMLASHDGDLSEYLSRDERGKKVVDLIQAIGTLLRELKTGMESESHQLQAKVQEVALILQRQQAYSGAQGYLEDVDLKRLVEAVVPDACDPARDVNVTLDMGDVRRVKAQKHRLMYILEILVNQCRLALITAGHSGRGNIHISAIRISTVRIALHIRHDGRGYAPDQVDEIFRQGFLDMETGFDLHHCATSMAEMGGTIRVVSQGLEAGATFILELNTPPHS